MNLVMKVTWHVDTHVVNTQKIYFELFDSKNLKFKK
jgi:hypothetical protein